MQKIVCGQCGAIVHSASSAALLYCDCANCGATETLVDLEGELETIIFGEEFVYGQAQVAIFTAAVEDAANHLNSRDLAGLASILRYKRDEAGDEVTLEDIEMLAVNVQRMHYLLGVFRRINLSDADDIDRVFHLGIIRDNFDRLLFGPPVAV